MERRHQKQKLTKNRVEVNYEEMFLEDGINETLDKVEELVLTHKELETFEPQKQIQSTTLANITVLSLSNNQLQHIEFLYSFPRTSQSQ